MSSDRVRASTEAAIRKIFDILGEPEDADAYLDQHLDHHAATYRGALLP